MKSRRSFIQDLAAATCATGLLCVAPLAAGEAAPPAPGVSASEVRSALARTSHISTHSANSVDASEAALRLAKAQRAREQGVQPLPGERVQEGGARVLTQRYWRRQEKLRATVEEAQRRSNEAGRASRSGRSSEKHRSLHTRLRNPPAQAAEPAPGAAVERAPSEAAEPGPRASAAALQ